MSYFFISKFTNPLPFICRMGFLAALLTACLLSSALADDSSSDIHTTFYAEDPAQASEVEEPLPVMQYSGTARNS